MNTENTNTENFRPGDLIEDYLVADDSGTNLGRPGIEVFLFRLDNLAEFYFMGEGSDDRFCFGHDGFFLLDFRSD